MEDDSLKKGLRAIPKTRKILVKELRDMATAATTDYRQFAYIPPWIRNIWHAAADMLEEDGRGKT